MCFAAPDGIQKKLVSKEMQHPRVCYTGLQYCNVEQPLALVYKET